jgi:hypothetical protein
MIKFLKSRSYSKIKGQRVTVMVSNERSYHKEYTYEIPCIYQSKVMTKVIVFENYIKLLGQRSEGQGHDIH